MQAELPKSVVPPGLTPGESPFSGHGKFSNQEAMKGGRRCFAQITIKNCFKWFTNRSTHTTPQRAGGSSPPMARDGNRVMQIFVPIRIWVFGWKYKGKIKSINLNNYSFGKLGQGRPKSNLSDLKTNYNFIKMF